MDTQNDKHISGEKSGTDIDMSADTDFNILRSKTFNRELKSLVNRIISNEERTEEEDLAGLTESQLLYRLHRIFYRIKSLDEKESAYSSFNPFIIDVENDLAKGIAVYLKTAFSSMEISLYDILAFNISDRCFSSTHTELKPETKTDIVINLKDRLYTQIVEEGNGYKLTPEEINRDSFLSKKFTGLEDEEGRGALLFIRLSSVADKLIKEVNRGHAAVPLVEYLSPIIIFRLAEQGRDEILKRVEVLRNELAVPLYLSLGSLLPSFDLQRYDDLDSMVGIAETLLAVSAVSEDLNGIMIKASRDCGKEMLYETKYLVSRLGKSLDGQASIIRLKSDLLIILTDKNNTGIVQAVVADYNKIHNNIFDLEIISMGNKDEISDILFKICI
jgi:hypothetical protein